MAKKKGSKEKKGKKQRRKTKKVSAGEFYDVKGDKLERKGKDCPKCGAGIKMAAHKTKDGKTRYSCGKCGMTTWE
jgi:small subunit ribosomal protein S27Ae